jgi:phenylacetate-coenzyme A ligase PaaK-like adenylate-forming protein
MVAGPLIPHLPQEENLALAGLMFLQQLLNGLTTGSVYALIALGYTMIYGILGLINFAQGEIYMCGAFVAVLLLATGRLNFYLAFAAGMVAAALLGVALERVAFRPLRGAHPLVPLISAIGREGHLDYLEVRLEVREGLFFDKMTLQRELLMKLTRKLEQGIGVTPRVKLVGPGSISRETETSPLVIDLRKQV